VTRAATRTPRATIRASAAAESRLPTLEDPRPLADPELPGPSNPEPAALVPPTPSATATPTARRTVAAPPLPFELPPPAPPILRVTHFPLGDSRETFANQPYDVTDAYCSVLAIAHASGLEASPLAAPTHTTTPEAADISCHAWCHARTQHPRIGDRGLPDSPPGAPELNRNNSPHQRGVDITSRLDFVSRTGHIVHSAQPKFAANSGLKSTTAGQRLERATGIPTHTLSRSENQRSPTVAERRGAGEGLGTSTGKHMRSPANATTKATAVGLAAGLASTRRPGLLGVRHEPGIGVKSTLGPKCL
jgi:hypothetical protein